MVVGPMESNAKGDALIEMTQQATVTLMYAASEMSMDEQADFAAYLTDLMDTYYKPKDITITGRTMEAILENWELDKKK